MVRNCLKPRDIEALLLGTLSARRAAAMRRHVGKCKDCAAALGEAEANEVWLRNLDADDELAELRQRIAHAMRAPANAGLTAGRSEG